MKKKHTRKRFRKGRRRRRGRGVKDIYNRVSSGLDSIASRIRRPKSELGKLIKEHKIVSRALGMVKGYHPVLSKAHEGAKQAGWGHRRRCPHKRLHHYSK